MAEKSIFWTTGSTGDGASPYTQAEAIRWFRQNMVGDNADEGVNKGYENELEVTGTSSPVAVNTGAAIVFGFPYWNTASVNVAVPTPSVATRIDLIVLEADWTAQTVRITRVAGTEGAGAPSLTQTDGVTWQIKLAEVSITTGGVITVTDARVFLHPNIEVETAMIADDAITTAKIADDAVNGALIADDVIDSNHYVDGSIDTAHLSNDCVDDTKVGNRVPQLYRRQGGSSSDWSTAGTTTYTPGAVRKQVGAVSLAFSGHSQRSVSVTFPTAFSNVPVVVVSLELVSGSTSEPFYTPVLYNVTASGFDVYVTHPSTVSGTWYVHWEATGPE